MTHGILPIALFSLTIISYVARPDPERNLTAKTELDNRCGSCHADGGNAMTPAKTAKPSFMTKDGSKGRPNFD